MQSIKNMLHSINKRIPVDYIIAGLFSAFFIASSFVQLAIGKFDVSELQTVNKVNILLFWSVFALCIVGLFLPICFLNKKEYVPRTLLISVVVFGVVTAGFNPENIYLIIGFAIIAFLSVFWSVKENKIAFKNMELSDKSLYISLLCIGLFVGLMIFAMAYFRYKSFNAQNFDFGIFASMFENMKNTGLPVTTCERNLLMSHFGVHFSPFFYLLLPIYMLFSNPATLIFLQTLFVVGGVVPLVLICKYFKLQNIVTLTLSVIYLTFPGFVCGAINDFHENAFLTFVILFLVYFMLKRKNVLFWIFFVLLLSIKEDAAIYALAIGLFMLFYRKEYAKSMAVILLSVFYFIGASMIVESFNALQTGVMVERFANYMPNGDNSLLGVVYTCFYDFPYMIAQVFTAEKISFLLWVLLPVAFMTFMSKRKSLLLLLIPVVVVNLMSDWQYQYDITYHYSFGTGALIIFAALLVISEKSNKKKAILGIFALIMSVIMCVSAVLPNMSFIPYYCSKADTFNKWDEFIDNLDKTQEYTATSSLIPHMYDFSQVYAYPSYYKKQEATKYFIARSEDFNITTDLESFIKLNNYEILSSEYGITLYEQK